MSILDEILGDGAGQLLGALTGAGLDPGEAKSFLPPAASRVMELVSGGDLDVASLLSKIDAGGLAAETGVPADKASTGLQALVPALLSLLRDKAGGVEGIASLLGGSGQGGLGALAGLAGKFLKP